MAKARMGFEGRAYIGTAGSTAATEVVCRDINYDFTVDVGDTTERPEDNDEQPPIGTESVTVRKVSITISKLNRAGDPTLETLLAASFDGTPIALRTKDYQSGKGYDGDVNVQHKLGKPLRGEQVYDFTFTPNGDLRAPQLYV